MKFKRVTKPVSWFTSFTCPSDFDSSGCVWCEPMLAQEISEAEQDKYFRSTDVYVEEKFDGTRGILQFFDNSSLGLSCVPQRGFTRCFSRRVSKKTNWFCENTDSVPHLRDINIPELAGTIIDGEMFIDGRPFKDVSSILNCRWDEAVRRQKKLGNITFHAFDILRYKNVNCEGMPLEQRKKFLDRVVSKVNSPNLVMVPYYSTDDIPIRLYLYQYELLFNNRESFPELYKQVKEQMTLTTGEFTEEDKRKYWAKYHVSKRAYYEYIVFMGGEGVILKPKRGRYHHKRGKEYMKVKKFLTREVLVTGYLPPTREYNGIFPKDRWLYWEDSDGNKMNIDEVSDKSARELKSIGYTPVSKFYYYDQIGTIEYGVILDSDDKGSIKKIGELEVKKCDLLHNGDKCEVLIVGECGGFTDEDREYITGHKDELIGSVIEVKANEIFKDTGKMRHPRFLRFRQDKNKEECTWKNHVGVID